MSGTRRVVALLLAFALGRETRLPALEFPGPQPGPARAGVADGVITLENNLLAMSWTATNGQFVPLEFVNQLATQSWAQAGSELFRIGCTLQGATNLVPASDFVLVSGPDLHASQPDPQSARAGDRLPGRELAAAFVHPLTGLRVDWRAVLRDGANYVRQFLTVSGTNADGLVTAVEMLDYATASAPEQLGNVPGSPVAAGQAFFGGETPFALNTLAPNRVRCGISGALPLGPALAYDFSAVAGVFPPGQLRRGFGYYLERERAAPYRPLLHFNSWLDLFQTYLTEANLLDDIAAFEQELHQRRGVALDAYALDDGWDDPSLGFWAVDTNKFPNGFDGLRDAAAAGGAHLGFWISPLAGYNWREQRIADGIAEGLFTDEPDLSSPAYYQWWTNRCATFIVSNGVSYFKWDNAGQGISPHFLALLRAADALRAYTTNLFINVTVGSWPSPFWLNHVDSTWRGGWDTDLAGVGNAREQWITYRDGQTWTNIVQRAPLYPLNSLMLHGIVLAHGGGAMCDAGPDLRHEARTFFGSGLNLQELYLTPSLLAAESWDEIAEAATWARANMDVLVDSHWVGGNPTNLEVYGWASWSPRKGILVLRNPSDQTNSLALDLGATFELPAGAPVLYDLNAAYAGQRVPLGQMQAGQPALLTLAPFEVLALDALPHTLRISRQSDGFAVTWPTGTLQQADSPEGPWTDLAAAVSPWPLDPTLAQRFFRVRLW